MKAVLAPDWVMWWKNGPYFFINLYIYLFIFKLQVKSLLRENNKQSETSDEFAAKLGLFL